MDLQLDRKEIFLISVILMMILAWTIGNLSGAYLGMQDEEIRGETESAEYEGGSTPFALNIPDILRDAFFASVIIGFVGWLFISDESWKGKTFRGGAFFIVISVIYFLRYIISGVLFTISQVKAFLPDLELPSITETIFGEGGQSTFSSGGTSIGILILLSSILLVIFFFIRHKKLLEQSSEAEEDISSTAEKAITELHEGDDVRDVIIRNYQKMLIILEEEGIRQEISFTPRELEKMALARLPLTEGTIDEMTRLFEEAKYSDHPLEEEERNRAIDNFKQIKDELEGIENA